jgi:hypothetical protein
LVGSLLEVHMAFKLNTHKLRSNSIIEFRG